MILATVAIVAVAIFLCMAFAACNFLLSFSYQISYFDIAVYQPAVLSSKHVLWHKWKSRVLSMVNAPASNYL